MPEKIWVDAKCPECGKPTRQQYVAKTLKNLLDRKESIKWFCEHCRHTFELGEQERVNLAKHVEERLVAE
jgi:ribosomal protein L37AE/L43A